MGVCNHLSIEDNNFHGLRVQLTTLTFERFIPAKLVLSFLFYSTCQMLPKLPFCDRLVYLKTYKFNGQEKYAQFSLLLHTLFNYRIQQVARQSHAYTQTNLKVNCRKTHTNAFKKKSLNYVWGFLCDSNLSKLFTAFLYSHLISVYICFSYSSLMKS